MHDWIGEREMRTENRRFRSWTQARFPSTDLVILPRSRLLDSQLGLRRPVAHPWLSYLARSYTVPCHCVSTPFGVDITLQATDDEPWSGLNTQKRK